MIFTKYLNVCNCYCLSEFGGPAVTYDEIDYDVNDEFQFELFKKHLLEIFESHDANTQEMRGAWGWKHPVTDYVPKLGIIMAVTADLQKETEDNLRRLGFHQFGPVSKLKHTDSKVSLWSIAADDLCKTIGYVSEYDPRTKEERGY